MKIEKARKDVSSQNGLSCLSLERKLLLYKTSMHVYIYSGEVNSTIVRGWETLHETYRVLSLLDTPSFTSFVHILHSPSETQKIVKCPKEATYNNLLKKKPKLRYTKFKKKTFLFKKEKGVKKIWNIFGTNLESI